MEITLITGNKKRHKYFANLLSKICDKLNVIEEIRTKPKKKIKKDKDSKYIKRYINNLKNYENKLFNIKRQNNLNFKKFKYSISTKELNKKKLDFLDNLKNSDLFILYGCSYIKKNLYNFLKKKKVICIHMGISPFYRGSDCNFWALYDKNPHLVGATILKLSRKFEEGDIIFHTKPKEVKDPQKFSILASMSAFTSLIKRIEDKSIFKLKGEKQNKKKIIRQTTKSQFTDKIVKKFFLMNFDIKKGKN
jgi:hypothetical protein